MLGVVVVSYRTDEETIAFVNDELSKIRLDKKIVVVNNAATIGSNARIAEGCGAEVVADAASCDLAKEIFVIGADENLGYSRGNNLGADFLLRHFDVEHLLFSNNDVSLTDPDVMETLLEVSARHDDAGMIGPRIVGLDGRDQSPSRYTSIWRKYTIPWLFYPLVYPLVRARFFKDVVPSAADGSYYRVLGCFMLVRARAFLLADGFDPHTFLYGEEEILAERMLANGYRAYYTGKASVLHQHGVVVKQFMDARRAYETSFESELYYYTSYIGIGKIAAASARLGKLLFLNLYLPMIKAYSSRRKGRGAR